jgi:hypothetical protein
MRRLAAGKSYSGVFGFRLRRIGTIASAFRKRALTDHPVPLQHYRN